MSIKKSQFIEWIEAIIIALIIVVSVRVFVFEAFTIPTSSMEKTLLIGDFIIVSKINKGARIPITPLSIPFTHKDLIFNKEIKSYSTHIQIPYYRLPGFSKIEHNDVLVFNYPLDNEHPIDHRTHYLKRCVGIPGDTLQIKEKVIYINSVAQEISLNYQFDFHFKSDDTKKTTKIFEDFNITEGGKISNRGDYRITTTHSIADSLKNNPEVSELTPLVEKEKVFQEYLFPFNENFKWNIDNYGPIEIPQKGLSVSINTMNLPLYEKIIVDYEKNNLEIIEDSIFINGEYAIDYQFKMDYYFMMGDNRHHSSDSRFWGFVPEDHIIGKAIFTLFSINKNATGFKRMRWDRFFKSIN